MSTAATESKQSSTKGYLLTQKGEDYEGPNKQMDQLLCCFDQKMPLDEADVKRFLELTTIQVQAGVHKQKDAKPELWLATQALHQSVAADLDKLVKKALAKGYLKPA